MVLYKFKNDTSSWKSSITSWRRPSRVRRRDAPPPGVLGELVLCSYSPLNVSGLKSGPKKVVPVSCKLCGVLWGVLEHVIGVRGVRGVAVASLPRSSSKSLCFFTYPAVIWGEEGSETPVELGLNSGREENFSWKFTVSKTLSIPSSLVALRKNLFIVGVVGVEGTEGEDGVFVLMAGVGPRMNLSSRSMSSLGKLTNGGGMVRHFLEFKGFTPELCTSLSPSTEQWKYEFLFH